MKTTGVMVASLGLLASSATCSRELRDATHQERHAATTLDAVVVTARKREEMLQEVPVAVTAFTAAALDRLNVRDLADLDAHVPNLTIYAARGASSSVTAYIRGVGQSDPTWGSDPGVGIYLDDVYIARPQGALLDVYDIARIEVLRGPQGTLYGKNTIGGAIKYISRGLPEQTEGFAEITVGNFNQLDIKAAIAGSIGRPNSGLRARVAAASLNRDGFGENHETNQFVSDKEVNAARLNLGADVTQNLNFQFSLDWIDDRSGMRGSRMLAGNRFAPEIPPMDDPYDVRSGMRNVNDVVTKGASATVNWRHGQDWAMKYVVAKRTSETAVNVDFDTTPYPIADTASTVLNDQVSHELSATFDSGGRTRGVIGVYLFDGEAGGQIKSLFNGRFFDFTGKVLTDGVAIYADWAFDLADRLTLDMGARYNDENKRAIVFNRFYSDESFNTPVEVTADFNRTARFTNLSPRISVDYDLTPDIMIYALASRGFKSGGFNIRANSVAVPRSAEPLNDESVESFELGSKSSFLDQRLFLNLSTFHNVYRDIQLSVFSSYDSNGDGIDDAFFGDFTNAGKGTVNGVELEFQYLPTAHWLVSGNLAWLDAEYEEYFDRGVNVAEQKRFTNAPEYSGALKVEYRVDLPAGGRLSAHVGYSYQTEVWPTTDLSPVIRQDGYGLLDAGVIWNISDVWTVSLQGSNLVDEEYRTTGYNLPSVGVLTGFYGHPRQYSLSIRREF